MAKSKKSSGIGAIDRQLQSVRKRISAVKKKKSQEKAAKKKAAALAKAKNELKRISGGSRKKYK